MVKEKTRRQKLNAIAKKYGIRLTKKDGKGYRTMSSLRQSILNAGGTIPAGLYSKATTTTSNRKAGVCRPRRTKAGLLRVRNKKTGRCKAVKGSKACKPGTTRNTKTGRCKKDSKPKKTKMVDGKKRTIYYNTGNGRWYYNTRSGRNGKATKHYVTS